MNFDSRVYAACKASSRVFVINPLYKRANFYSQQLRGLALVREMFRSGSLSSDSQVIVIGGGVTGLTIAAAALTGKATVTLVDKGPPFARYREAMHRELHPNIIAWPFQPLRAATDLPFLNWVCCPAHQVIRQIERQWQRDFAKHVRTITDEAEGIVEAADHVTVSCRGRGPLTADVVIVAVGWMQERQLADLRTPSYWTPPPFEGPDEVVVSGSGDGGLIDGAYQAFGPRTVEASRVLAYLLEGKPHKDRIAAAERTALAEWTSGRKAEASHGLQRFYSAFSLEDEDAEELRLLKRHEPITSRLVHREESAYSPLAAPANKALFSFLANDSGGAVSTSRGVVRKISGGGPRDIEEKSSGEAARPLDPMRLLVRHGADAACTSLLSDAQKDALGAADPSHLTEFVPDDHDRLFYSRKPARRLAATSNHRQSDFQGELDRQISVMLEHFTFSMTNIWIDKDVDKGGDWVVRSTENEKKRLRPLFPMTVRGVRLTLGDEQHATFQAL